MQIHRHLTQAAHQWEKAGHDLDDLYRGARLHQSEEWAKENGAEMNALESDFLKASKNEVLKQHEVNRRRRVVIAGALGLALVVTTLGITGQLNRYFFQPVDMDDYWIEIPAGEFIMGSEDADGDEAPIHTVSLDTYWIGRYEITNMQYAQCEKSGECLGRGSSVASSSHPAVNVSWNDAQTYCEWVGGSLPTEAQWEKAARGTDGRTYPWESEGIDESLANIDANIGDTTPVGSYPKGASPYGALDMAGNVWEWVADWYANDYYASSPNENPAGPQHGTFRVLRGGAWYNGSGNVRAADRYYESMTLSYFGNGFRCAASVQP